MSRLHVRPYPWLSSRDQTLFAVAMLIGFVMGAPPISAQCPTVGCTNGVVGIGALPGLPSTYAAAVSNNGVVVGSSAIPIPSSDAQSAFRWSDGVIKDLGTLPGGVSASSAGVSADGSIVVGTSVSATGGSAFRWTPSTGMQDLGIASVWSGAAAVSSDGLVVVGTYCVGQCLQRAYRWTSSGGAQDLGLASTFREAGATAVNSDGTVIVGFANVTTGGGTVHGFRWSQADGMQDLPTLAGVSGQSSALAVSGDGTTTVGYSSTAQDFFQIHAVKWTAAGIADLGTLPGGYYSLATGVSYDGSIVVGSSTGSSFANMHAFRWTPKTGMRDLNTLMAAAGVNMSGIVLTRATAISENGQFIVGSARFGDTERAYLVRYLEAPPNNNNDATIAGTTEITSVQQSIDDLSNARRSAAVHQHGFAAPLLGGDKPMRQSNDIAAFGSVGSLAAGAAARFAFGDRITILGGLSYTQEDYQNTELRNATTGALAMRYIHTDFGAWQPFVEGGGWLTPHASMRFTRSYANGAGLASGVGSTESKMTYAFGRVGFTLDIDKNNHLSLSGEYGRQRMSISGYAEPLSSANPFEAQVPDGTDASDLLKARAQYTVNFTDHVDTTLWAGAVRSFNQTSGLTAAVAGIGTLSPSSNSGTTWAEYGARIGYKISNQLTLDVFSGGISGRDGIGTKVHSGAGVRFRF